VVPANPKCIPEQIVGRIVVDLRAPAIASDRPAPARQEREGQQPQFGVVPMISAVLQDRAG